METDNQHEILLLKGTWTEAMEGTKVDDIMFGLKIYIFIPNKYIYSK